jgi:hypothetical protein
VTEPGLSKAVGIPLRFLAHNLIWQEVFVISTTQENRKLPFPAAAYTGHFPIPPEAYHNTAVARRRLLVDPTAGKTNPYTGGGLGGIHCSITRREVTMRSPDEIGRSELATSLSSIRDFQGSHEDREELLMLAFSGYMVTTGHVHRLSYPLFKVTVNDHFKVQSEINFSTDLRIFMKAALGIDIKGMPVEEV